MPPGIFPPNILKYDASSVPILQLGLESKTLSEQEIYDLGQNFIRTPLATVQGAAVPSPYGGKQRQIMVDLDPDALYAKQLSATDVSNALNLQNLILPAGTVKIGDTRIPGPAEQQPGDAQRDERSADQDRERRHGLPEGRGARARRVSRCRPTSCAPTATRGALLTILRNGQASTLDIVNEVKAALPKILAAMPPGAEGSAALRSVACSCAPPSTAW